MKAILSILVALGIPAAFWNYYLKESPDVQYSLSAAIPLAFQELPKDSKETQDRNEFVQQIEVANSGRGEAKKIVLKIPKAIIQYRLAKHSTSEQVEIYRGPAGFELSYPSLPPANGFQITLKTNGAPLTESQLEVFHQGGKAKIVSPGSRSGESSFWSLAWLLIPVFYLWLFYSSFRDEFKYRFLFRRYSPDIAGLLRNERPWYIRRSDWPEVIEDLLKRALSESMSLYSAISNSTPYRLLSSDKPIAVPQTVWEKIKETSSERLLDLAKSQAKRFSTEAEISDLLNTQWPDGLSEANKATLVHSISVVYFDRILGSSSAEDLVTILAENRKHPKVSTDAWEKFKDRARNEITKSLATRIVSEENINAVANLPEWELISNWDKSKLSKLQAARIAAAEANEKLNEAQALFEEKRKEVHVLNEQLVQLESNLESRELAVAAKEIQISTLRDKVHRQLDVIERVIADPAYLDRIEPDDNTFVAGNWVLLRRLVTKRH